MLAVGSEGEARCGTRSRSDAQNNDYRAVRHMRGDPGVAIRIRLGRQLLRTSEVVDERSAQGCLEIDSGRDPCRAGSPSISIATHRSAAAANTACQSAITPARDPVIRPRGCAKIRIACLLSSPRARSPGARRQARIRIGFQRPVSACGACTGLDSGDHRCRRYTASHTIAAMARNSLCQF